MKKYWVIVRENNTFNAYPADERTLRDVIEIAITDREFEGYWVAEQIEYHKPSPLPV